jgi:hypothetical protein
MQQKKRVIFGGRMCLSWLTISEGLLLAKLGMEELFSSGLMFGMTFYLSKDFQGFSPLPRIQIFLWPSSSKKNQLECQFHLPPLYKQAYLEYQELQQVISQIQVDDSSNDSWHYAWGNSTYTSSKFYHYPYRSVNPPRPFLWI